MATLRADNSSQYQLSSQTGARFACHSLRPQTKQIGTEVQDKFTILIYLSYPIKKLLREEIETWFYGSLAIE